MLVLKRKEGQWVEITHKKSGHCVRIRVVATQSGQAELVFDDPPRNFNILREEKKQE